MTKPLGAARSGGHARCWAGSGAARRVRHRAGWHRAVLAGVLSLTAWSGCHGRSSATVTRSDSSAGSGASGSGNAILGDVSESTRSPTPAPQPAAANDERTEGLTDRNVISTGALTVTVTWRKPPPQVHERPPQCDADLPRLPLLSTTRMVNEVLVFLIPEARGGAGRGAVTPSAAQPATTVETATPTALAVTAWLDAALTARACGVAPRLRIIEPSSGSEAALVVRRDIGGPRAVHVALVRDWPGAQAFATMATEDASSPVTAAAAVASAPARATAASSTMTASSATAASSRLAASRLARASIQLPVPGHAAAVPLAPGLYQVQGDATATAEAPSAGATVLVTAWPAAVTGSDGSAQLRAPAGAYRVFAYLPPRANNAIAGKWMHTTVQLTHGAVKTVAFDLADAE